MTHSWIVGKANEMFALADDARKRLRTADQVKRYLSQMRAMFEEKLGGFPEKTPLNAKILGCIERKTHRIEKVVFESRPGFVVSANLYLPRQFDAPAPGVVVAMGHIDNGKAYPEYQKVCMDLVLNGFVVLGFDPIGQGERIQFPSKRRFKSRLTCCVNEHANAGWRSELLGISLGGMMIWDGIRALDYLAGRPEVAADRLGMTGCSGGGTQTTFVMAIDRRLKAAVPNCFITSRKVLVGQERILFDPEQVQFGVIRDGLDHAELVSMAAPAAVLVQGGLQDLGFHPSGTRWSVKIAKQLFTSLGIEDRIAFQQEDLGHGYFLPFRQRAVQWFCRFLKGQEVEFNEPALKTEDMRTLWCTRSGNVLELGGKTVLDILREQLDRLAQARVAGAAAGRKRADTAGILRKTLNIKTKTAFDYDGKATACGRTKANGCEIVRYMVRGEPGITIPTVVIHPPGGAGDKAVVAVSEKGKQWELENNRLIPKWLASNHTVILPDLRGWGETRQTKKLWPSPTDHWCWTIGPEGFLEQWMLQLGDSLIGSRARDIAAVLAFVGKRVGVAPRDCLVFSRGISVWSAAVVCHFKCVGGLAAVDFLASYAELFRCEVPKVPANYIIHGALKHFDFPEVLAGLSPLPLWIRRPMTATGTALSADRYDEFIQTVRTGYAGSGAEGKLSETLRSFS
ncbi:MAG: acetylxylan esterase [Planctomycetes bacterium]|nr:acetylxylan esterase [Planctomycetota bacterium]